MFDQRIVRAEASLIPDPKGLLQLIDEVMGLPNQTPASRKILKAVKDLIIDSVRIETIQVNVDVKSMLRFEGDETLMAYTIDELQYKMGRRLVELVAPVVTIIDE